MPEGKRRTQRGEQLGTVLDRLDYFNTHDLNEIGTAFFDAFEKIEITHQDLVDDQICGECPDFPELPEYPFPPFEQMYAFIETDGSPKGYDELMAGVKAQWHASLETTKEEWGGQPKNPEDNDDLFNLKRFAEEIDVAAELVKELADRGYKIVKA